MPARTYEALPGFFVQDEGCDDDIQPILPHFGLLDSSEDKWSRFCSRLQELNEAAPKGVEYRLTIAGRHGQGYHNMASIKYGKKQWVEYWARRKVDDGEIVWAPDAVLTPLGEDQTREANAVWLEEVAAGAPPPDGLYCSPMTRALQTCRLTFSGVVDFASKPPLILEVQHFYYCLETGSFDLIDMLARYMAKTPAMNGAHVHIFNLSFPNSRSKTGSEEDQLHDPNVCEAVEHVVQRARSVV